MKKQENGHKKIKVATIFGTRPEIIRLCRTLAELDRHVDHITIHTGQSYDYELSEIFFKELGVRKPNYFLEVKSDTLGGQIAKIIERSEEVLAREKPDAVAILGDTNSALAAIVAKRMKIPIFHMEAGNRSFDENVPEETNRRIVDHISDINMPYSENARKYLIREGIHPGTIFVTGTPMTEVLTHYAKKIDGSKILSEMKLKKGGYFVASIHREENVESRESLKKLVETLKAVAEKYKLPIIMSLHPRTKARLEKYKLKLPKSVRALKPMGYFDYNKLQKNSFCVLSDSGSIYEEAAILKMPAVHMRVSQERPEAFDEGVAILSGLEKDAVISSIEVVTAHAKEGKKFNIPKSYQDTNFSAKVVRLIIGYAGIVKKRRALN